MADYSFAGVPIVAGNLMQGLVGTWTCDAFFAEPESPVQVGQRGTLSVLGYERAGTVARAGADGGYARARIVGGAGMLNAVLPPTTYRGYQAGAIAVDCLTAAGESPGSGWDAIGVYCQHWHRASGPCKSALQRLSRLVDDPALHWRATADGDISLVTETWPSGDRAVSRDAWSDPQENLAVVYPTNGSLDVGQSVTAFGAPRRAERVLYQWDEREVTCSIWYAD